MTKQIEYNNANFLMRFEFPPDWDVDNLTGVNISIATTTGTELLAAAAATLYTADTLAGAVTSGNNAIILTTGNALAEGDRIRISGGHREDRTVRDYTAASKTANLTADLDWDHANLADIDGLFCTYDLDTSTVATWTSGLDVVVSWTPVGIDVAAYTETYEIAKSGQYQASDFDERFEAQYRREYRNFGDYLDTIRIEAQKRLTQRLKARGLNMDRVVDQEILMPTHLALTRQLLIRGTGEAWIDERKEALDEYNTEFKILTSDVIWADDDQDGVKDSGESDIPSEHTFDRGL